MEKRIPMNAGTRISAWNAVVLVWREGAGWGGGEGCVREGAGEGTRGTRAEEGVVRWRRVMGSWSWGGADGGRSRSWPDAGLGPANTASGANECGGAGEPRQCRVLPPRGAGQKDRCNFEVAPLAPCGFARWVKRRDASFRDGATPFPEHRDRSLQSTCVAR